MMIKGTCYFCDGWCCKEYLMLEEGEELSGTSWFDIPGEGQFCEECGISVLESLRD